MLPALTINKYVTILNHYYKQSTKTQQEQQYR